MPPPGSSRWSPTRTRSSTPSRGQWWVGLRLRRTVQTGSLNECAGGPSPGRARCRRGASVRCEHTRLSAELHDVMSGTFAGGSAPGAGRRDGVRASPRAYASGSAPPITAAPCVEFLAFRRVARRVSTPQPTAWLTTTSGTSINSDASFNNRDSSAAVPRTSRWAAGQ
jgi:hypothetical protein